MIKNNQLDKRYAKKANFEWKSIRECVQKLIQCRENGENVYVTIGEYALYSSDVTISIVDTLEILLSKEKHVRNIEEDYER